MRKHIIRATLLGVVIMFSMLAAFTQGMKVNCGKDVRWSDMQTVASEIHAPTENGTCISVPPWMEKVEEHGYGEAVKYAANRMGNTDK